MNSWKIILACLVIFGAGVITGGLLVDHVNRPKGRRPVRQFVASTNLNPVATQIHRDAPPTPEQRRLDFMSTVSHQLDLSAEQRERVEAILRDGQERVKIMWEPFAARMREEMTEIREKFRAELTAEQRKKFEELMKRPQRRPDASSTNLPPRDVLRPLSTENAGLVRQTNAAKTVPNP